MRGLAVIAVAFGSLAVVGCAERRPGFGDTMSKAETDATHSVTFRVIGMMKTRSGAT